MIKYLYALTSILLMVWPLYSQASHSLNLDDLMQMSLEELLNVEVSTSSKYSEKLQDAPANFYIITKEQIQERGYRSIGDMLKALPGVDVNDFSRSSSPMVITFHGHTGNNK